MRRLWILSPTTLIAIVILVACTGTFPPDPRVSGVTPDSAAIGEPVTLTIQGENFSQTGNSADPDAWSDITVTVCGVELENVTLVDPSDYSVTLTPTGSVRVRLATGLTGVLTADAEPGVSDVVVQQPGRPAAVLPGAFECLAPAAPVARIATSPSPAEGVAPLVVAFDASASTAGAAGISAYEWDFGDGAEGEGVTATHTYALAGEYTVALTIRTDDGESDSTTTPVTVLPAPAIAITPESATVMVRESQQFTATLTGLDDDTVEWTATGGTITAEGLFTAGEDPGTFAVTARSSAQPSLEATATIEITLAPALGISPPQVTLFPEESTTFTASASGIDSSDLVWHASGGTITGAGETATYTAPAATGSYEVTVSSTDPVLEATATVTVVARPTIVVSPAAATVYFLESQQFTATVTGLDDTSVTWQATGGSVDTAGLFTAGSVPGDFEVTATSTADPTLTATAAVVVAEQPSIAINPVHADVFTDDALDFTATIVGLADTGVTWSSTGGTVTGTGLTVTYTAPAAAGDYELTVNSTAHPTLSATATIAVTEREWRLDPQTITLDTGQATTFTVLATGLDADAVQWTADAGSIIGTGATVTYTAPATAGQATITATSTERPEYSASADITVIAQTAMPQALWTVHFGMGDDSFPSDVAAGSGNMSYVAMTYGEAGQWGFSGMVAIDDSGTVTRQVPIAVPADGQSRGIEWSPQGRIYLAGVNWDSQTAFIASLSEADPTAQAISMTTPLGDQTEFHGVAVDASGNAVIAGVTRGDQAGSGNLGNWDALFRAYDATATPVFTVQFGTAEADELSAIALDSAGNIIVGGHTTGVLEAGVLPQGTWDGFVRKYSPDGQTVLWTRQFGTDSFDFVRDVVIDEADNIYVVGQTSGALFGPEPAFGDSFIASYSADGTLRWAEQFGDTGYTNINAAAIDNYGNLYVAGQTHGQIGDTSFGDWDGFVLLYDSAGNRIWSDQFGTPEGDQLFGMALDQDGNVLVVGASAGALGQNPAAGGSYIRKYSAYQP